MNRQQVASVVPAEPAQRNQGQLAAAAVAGIVGPILFAVAAVVQGLFRVGEYDAVRETVSELEAGPGGWIQQVNFVVFGTLTIAFALGLHRGIRPTRAGWVGPAILVVTGLGLFWAAAFPVREDAAGVLLPLGLHVVSGVAFFLGSAVGLIVLSRRLAADPRWRSLAGYTLGVGIALVVVFVVNGPLAIPDGAPLHAYGGVMQRIYLFVVLFPCMIVLALRLRRPD